MNVAQTAQTGAPATPKEMGLLSRMISKAWGGMTPADRVELMTSAASESAEALAKATTLLNNSGEGQIEDLWDGNSDAQATVRRTGGPGSEIASGTPVGPSQSASGNGAMEMERKYSRTAPQDGVEAATSALGRYLAKSNLAKAVGALATLGEVMSKRLEMLESGVALAKAIEPADIESVVAAALAKALPAQMRALSSAFAKAMDEDEGEDEEAAKAIAKSDDDDVKVEVEEEGCAKSVTATEAAKARLVAKGLVRLAKRALAKAEEAADEKKEDDFKENFGKAKSRLAKARTHFAVAEALAGDTAGASTQALGKSIGAVAKAIAGAGVEMQNKWPTSAAKPVGKSAESAPAGASPDLAKAIETITAAASGMGMMTATMSELTTALMRSPAPGTDALPPVFSLAKATPQHIDAAAAGIAHLVDSNAIGLDDGDRARDVLAKARMGVPVDGMVASLPEAVQRVLRNQNAA